jgi:hypothetical protein
MAGSSHILTSTYNQPRIVEAYLSSTLKDPNFPTSSIQSLQSLINNDSEEGNEGLVRSAFEEIHAALSIEQNKALQEAIRAISLSSTLSETADDVEQRLLLAYCRILNRQWKEAIVDFDLIRNHLYSKIKSGTNDQDLDLSRRYIDALKGLQLASILLGKMSDVANYRKWTKSHQESRSKS